MNIQSGRRLESIGGASVIGRRPVQQDRYMYSTRRGLIVVADGHGPEGQLVAQAVKEHFWDKYRQPQIELPDDLTPNFHAIDRSVEHVDGGSTATVVRVEPPMLNSDGSYDRRIVTNYVGDSSAILVATDPDQVRPAEFIIPLVKPHTISNMEEVTRMAQAGSDLCQIRSGVYFSGEDGNGLAISRALGDYAMGRAFIAHPTRTVVRSRRGRLLIVMSDGVLAPNTTEELAAQAFLGHQNGHTMGQIATRLAESGAKITGDNATAVVAHLPAIPQPTRGRR